MVKLIVLLFLGLAAFSFCQDDVNSTTACPDACIGQFDPVCGENGQGTLSNFSSPCELDSYNCKNPDDQYNVVDDEQCSLNNATTTNTGPVV